MGDPEAKFEEWERYAEEDRQMAEIALKEDGPPNQICFHAQQIAEKYLKGFLVVSKKRFEKRHQLDYLLNLCENVDPAFKELTKDIEYLTEFYIPTRYPGDFPLFSQKEAKEAYDAAVRVRNFVFDKFKEKA